MRVTYTPFPTPTRAIGSDIKLTLELILAISTPKLTMIEKIKRLFKL